MKPGPEADALYLDNIVELIELIRGSLAGMDRPAFLEDRTTGDATALRLGAFGEASRKLSEQLRARHPQIEWVKMYGLRNIVAHHYERLDYRIIWKVATASLDRLNDVCRAELASIDE